jgi:hypothetical protein
VGGSANREIPLLLMSFYLCHHVAPGRGRTRPVLVISLRFCVGELRGRHRQVGSLAGAAHLLNDNTGVLR